MKGSDFMTNNDRNEIRIAINYLKLLAVMNGISIKGPKTRFWSHRDYQITSRATDMTEEQKEALITNITRIEKMIERS
jgi:hypothetical protein